MPDDPLAHFKEALAIFQKDPVPWVVLYGALVVLSVFTFGLGMVLAPNAIRATRDALREERSPDLGQLFVFDDLLEDAIATFGLIVTVMITSTVAGPLSTAAGFLLGYAPPAVTEDEVGGLDALSMSVTHFIEDPVPPVVHGLIGSLVNLPAICCLFPIFVTLPITGIAHWLFYETRRERLLKLPAPQN